MLVDTHCHIHEPSYPLDSDKVLRRAHEAGVQQLICVGTSEKSSREAAEFATRHENVFAAVGVHPHDTKDGWSGIDEILNVSFDPSLSSDTLSAPSRPHTTALMHRAESAGHKHGGDVIRDETERAPQTGNSTGTEQVLSRSITPARKHLQPEHDRAPGPLLMPGTKPFSSRGNRKGEQNNNLNSIVAVGEIGLDYFYTHSPRNVQIKALEAQIDLALRHNLPVIFHVREAFDDFWPIFDNFQGIRGELHSFTDTQQHLDEALKRGLFIGVNGISTFTKADSQRVMFSHIPLERLLLETDAPFLTPVPFRGKINEPAFVKHIAQYHAEVRDISLEEIAATTTTNAHALFALS